MSKTQEYLDKIALDKKIKEKNLPMMYIVYSNHKGVEPIREVQVTDIEKSVSVRLYNKFSSVPAHRYHLNKNEFPPFIEIEEGKISASDVGIGSGFGDLWSWTHYCTLDKKDAENYTEQESKRIEEKYGKSVNSPIENVKEFLRKNGLTEVENNIFTNEKVKVEINIDVDYYVVSFDGGTMYSDNLNIYWLVGVLTYYNLIERDYKSLNDNNK